MTQKHWSRYQESVQSVIDYIHDNPAGPVDNDALAEIACLSTFHWHRIYRGITGETAVQTVRNVRMNIAAGELIRTTDSIAAIGRAVGYPTVQSFTRAFKTYYAQTPGEFRTNFQEPPIISTLGDTPEQGYEVKIIEQEPMRLIGLEHRGDYMHVGRAFAKVFAANITHSKSSAEQIGVGVYFDDPASFEDLSRLTSFAGVVVAENTAVPNGFTEYNIAASRCAVATYTGPHASLELPYLWMFGNWLPASGLELDNQPAYEMYLNNPADVAPEELLTRICIPVT